MYILIFFFMLNVGLYILKIKWDINKRNSIIYFNFYKKECFFNEVKYWDNKCFNLNYIWVCFFWM